MSVLKQQPNSHTADFRATYSLEFLLTKICRHFSDYGSHWTKIAHTHTHTRVLTLTYMWLMILIDKMRSLWVTNWAVGSKWQSKHVEFLKFSRVIRTITVNAQKCRTLLSVFCRTGDRAERPVPSRSCGRSICFVCCKFQVQILALRSPVLTEFCFLQSVSTDVWSVPQIRPRPLPFSWFAIIHLTILSSV
jgi:hypothetical protein